MTEQKVGFILSGIKTEQFSKEEKYHKAGKDVDISTELSFVANLEDRVVGVIATFSYEQAKKTFLKLSVNCQFQLIPETWENCIQDEKLVIPKALLAHLSMLTVGTSRGVLFAKTENTIFNVYILPTINVSAMIKEDAVFELPQ